MSLVPAYLTTAATTAGGLVLAHTFDLAAEGSAAWTDGNQNVGGKTLTVGNQSNSSTFGPDGSTGVRVVATGGDDTGATQTAPYLRIPLSQFENGKLGAGYAYYFEVDIAAGSLADNAHRVALLAQDITIGSATRAGTDWRRPSGSDIVGACFDTSTPSHATTGADAVTPAWLGLQVFPGTAVAVGASSAAPGTPEGQTVRGAVSTSTISTAVRWPEDDSAVYLAFIHGGAGSNLDITIGAIRVYKVVATSAETTPSTTADVYTKEIGPDDWTTAAYNSDGDYTIADLTWTFENIAAGPWDVDGTAGTGLDVVSPGASTGGSLLFATNLADWLAAEGATWEPGKWTFEVAIQGEDMDVGAWTAGWIYLHCYIAATRNGTKYGGGQVLVRDGAWRKTANAHVGGTPTDWGNLTPNQVPALGQWWMRMDPQGEPIVAFGYDSEVTTGVRPGYGDLPTRGLGGATRNAGDAAADPTNAASPLNSANEPWLNLSIAPKGAALPGWRLTHVWLRATKTDA